MTLRQGPSSVATMTIITTIQPLDTVPLPTLQTTVVLAISLDGKIADASQSAARFGSVTDRHHLETQIAQADAVLFGAGTLRAYGTTLRVLQPELQQQRHQRHQSPQPIQVVCSRTGDFSAELPFFNQDVPRWLLTTAAGGYNWYRSQKFDQILIAGNVTTGILWQDAFQHFATLGWQRILVLGGTKLVTSLLAADLLDDLWVTICPLILGGPRSRSLVSAEFLVEQAPRLELLEMRQVEHEVFLHYRFLRTTPAAGSSNQLPKTTQG